MINLLFRDLCVHCLQELTAPEPLSLCPICQIEINQRTSVSSWSEVVKERIKENWLFTRVRALVSMAKDDPVHSLIHSLKYDGRKDIGRGIGRLINKKLSGELASHDYLLPIPVHKRRRLERGFNQTECIVEGINEERSENLSFIPSKRETYTRTQTRLSRLIRARNVKNRFSVSDPHFIQNRDIWILDDVITTGSTVVTMAETILPLRPRSINLLVFAVTV